jgi:plastocyanin
VSAAAPSIRTPLAAVAMAIAALLSAPPARAATGTGTIKGIVRLTGKAPGNPIIRMGMDPMCAKMNAGKRVVDEIVETSDNGGLENAFVKVEGTFPNTPVPAQPVVIDQRGCVYVPRVVGARVGQVLRIKNSDNLLHNVHAITTKNNEFNVGQPVAGIQYDFKLKAEEMLRLKCDVHRWMTAWVGVVNHPYFAVTHDEGTFSITGVPAGRHTISAWHERFGMQTQTIDVKPGAVTTVTFTYTGNEKP